MHRTVLLVATLVVLAPIAGVAGAATPAPATTAPVDAAESTYDGVINTSNDSIGIWKSTPLPLRADSDAGATKAQGQQVFVDHWAEDQRADARYGELAVYDNETTIPLQFKSGVSGANIDQFDGDTASVIVGKFTGDADAETALSAAPSSVAELKDMFGEDRLAEVNENVTFAEVDTESISADEGFEAEFTPDTVDAFGDGVGQYVVLAAVAENDNAAPNLVDGDNNLSPMDDAVIVGADALVVHEEASDVDVSDAEPGDTVTFDVDALVGNDGDVHHAVALYHKDTVAQSATVFNLTAPVDEDFTADDVIVEPDIGTVNGVSDLDDGVPAFGDAVGSASHSGTVTVSQIVEFLEGELNTTAPEVDPGDTTLDASVVSLADANSTADLSVETFGNWTEGEYQWVHVAATEAGELATSADTITIEEDDDGGGGPSPPPTDPGPDIELVDTSLSSAKVSPGETFEISATFENVAGAPASKTVELTRDGQTVDETTINLAPGAEETVTFVQSIDEPGSYRYAVDGTTVGTVDVSSKDAAFETSNADVSDTDVSVGDSVDVTATVENTGDATGTHTAELVIDGETVDTTEVTLEPGASDAVEFSHTFDEAGDYEVNVDDATAGTVSVEDDGGDGIPGFGPVAALLGLAATLLIARTRSS